MPRRNSDSLHRQIAAIPETSPFHFRGPPEHRALEEYFLTLAKKYDAEAAEHTTTTNTYRGTKIAVHCDRLVSLAREEAKEATAAAMHKQLVNIAR